MEGQRADLLAMFPWAKTLISIVCRMNREPIRSTARSAANLEFHHTTDHTNEVARTIVAALEDRGARACTPSAGFPRRLQRFPAAQIFLVSRKPRALAAGLGPNGHHRKVVAPQVRGCGLVRHIV